MARNVSRLRRRQRAALLFLAPQLIGLFLFTGYPLMASLYYSFTHWDLIAPAPSWIGLGNWQALFSDGRVYQTLVNTGIFLVAGTGSFLVFSLVAALVVYSGRRRTGAYRAFIFAPFVISGISVGIIWRWMFNSESGPVTLIAGILHLPQLDWLNDARTAMAAIALVTTWQAIGYGMTIFISGLQGVPTPILEAAMIDGVNLWQRFKLITLPLISPTVLFLTVTSVIGGLQLFDPVVAMTGSTGGAANAGGPDGSTRTIALYMYQQMFNFNESISGLGYAAAIAWLLCAVTLIVTLIQWVASRRLVFYAGDKDTRENS